MQLPTLAQSKAGVAIYDKNNKYVCTVYADRDKDPVALSQVSPNMRNAIVSAEDHNFYKHHGVDPVGIMRAAFINWKSKKTVQGASTLTQQLARNLYLNKDDRSFSRKLREAFIAWDIESAYSKSKILECYLNEVYFGGGVHGVERASEHYFAKHASQLNVSESAFLAGLVRCPTVFGSTANRALAMHNRDRIIGEMQYYGYINANQAASARGTQLAFKTGPSRLRYPQYITYVLGELDQFTDADTRKQGCKVYTNLDPKLQAKAVADLTQGIKHAPKGIDQGAMVTISLKDGAILAMVGGAGSQNSEWNRATHPHTAGSSFKPFVYLTGLIKGVIQQDTAIEDEPYSIEAEGMPPYQPHNFDGSYKGWMTCRDALAQSRNVCSVRVAEACGIDSVVETAHAAGVRAQLDAYPSLALGSCAVSPLDMANAYATLARYGGYMPASTIRKVESLDGKVIEENRGSRSQNLPAEQVAQLVDVMQDVVRHGTGMAAALPGIAVAGKTGTADKGKDIWFVGFTPDTVTAVWGGNDHNKAVRGTHVTGGGVMAHIWKSFMTDYYHMNRPTQLAFAPPATPLIAQCPEYVATAMTSSELLSAHSTTDSQSPLQLAAARGIVNLGDVQQALAEQRNRQIAREQTEREMAAVLQRQQQVAAANVPVGDTTQWGASTMAQWGGQQVSATTVNTTY
ncbi:MAG TPA: PBP1A family penicillin-binding protein [Planktothrix sp.]